MPTSRTSAPGASPRSSDAEAARHRQRGIRAGTVGRRDHRLGGRAAEDELEPVVGQQPGGPARGPRRDRVRHRLAPAAVRGEPACGTRVQLRLDPGVLQPQARAQELREQAVVAEPALVAVERGDEHPRALELLQYAGAVVAAGQRVRELAAQPLRHARAQEELAPRRRLQGEDLVGQVVGHRAVVAGELGDEGVRVILAGQGQPGQPQPRRPALGPLHEALELVRAQGEPEAGEHRRALLRGEREVGGAHLAEATGEAQPGEREVRVGAGGTDDVEPVAEAEQLAQRRDRSAADALEVVQHDDRASGRGGQRVGKPQGERVVERVARRLEALERRPGAAQCGEHVGPEARRVGMAGRQRQPRGAAVRRPARQQHRLAPARRGGDEGQRAFGPGVESRVQARARDGGRGEPG